MSDHKCINDNTAKPDDTVNTIISILRQNLDNIDAIFIFGSFGTEHFHKDSDIDIAVLTQPTPSDENLFNVRNMLSRGLHRETDLIDLYRVNTVFKQQILSTGHEIYTGDAFKTELFKTHTLSDYVDLNERRADIIKDIQQRGSILG